MDTIPLNRKAVRRFYQPVALTKALTDISRENGSSHAPEPHETPTTEKTRFHSFVNKLATICDKQKGGSTVAAFTVLQHPGGILYIFGCNQVSHTALQEMAGTVTTLLNKVVGVSDMGQAAEQRVCRELQKLILKFSRPRVESYVRGLQGSIALCDQACRALPDTRASVLLEALDVLSESLRESNPKTSQSSDYLASCFRCIRAIKTFFSANSGIPELINQRARQGRMPGMTSLECWSELRHHISRLLSYEYIALELIEAEREWPQLFRDFEVLPLPSSRAEKTKPLGQKGEKAHSIIGHMTDDDDEIDRYRGLAQDLQRFDLDGRIQEQCNRPSFRPYVHAEILVLDWVCANTTKFHARFFQSFRYIGSSKPTCKLCDYYFKAHPGRVEARPTHGNLYLNWRFPDVFRSDGEAAIVRRQKIYNSLRLSICYDGFRIMDDKRPMYKKHDSNTYSVMSARQTDAQSDVYVEDLRERFTTGLTLEDEPRYEEQEGPESDDEDGGTSLS